MSVPPPKDIPPARRQVTEVSLEEIENLQLIAPKKKLPVLPIAMSLLLGGLGGLGYWQWDWLQPRLEGARGRVAQASVRLFEKDESGAAETAAQDVGGAAASSSSGSGDASAADASDSDATDSGVTESDASAPVVSANPVAIGSEDEPDQLLNHRRYEVKDEADLVPLNPSSTLLFAPDAQVVINEMVAKAKAEGVQLGVISGFRTLEDQNYLYFDLKAERGQTAQTRAAVSAPPGYSEHHTGYAVDFIDESVPSTHLEESFETTAAFKWLEKNAPFFNFEMSFPKGNEANVSYEPWHWRYVGNQESLELFYK